MENVAFVRTRIENITSFFAKDEVSEIWITFPDPQLKRINALKRLTSSVFLGMYKTILKPQGIIHLKTDSQELHQYTKSLAELNNLKVHSCTNDLYSTVKDDPILSIRTFYEQQFLDQGKTITYISFELTNENPFIEHKYQRT
jgi:tRNA (guanine-N7-)-methyltransferase